MAFFSFFRTSPIIARIVKLSWLQLGNIWTNVIVSSTSEAGARRITTVMCQGIPRFANQLVWLSLYWRGRYFIAQSWTSKTESLLSSSTALTLASSWFTERRRWAFQANMLLLACSTINFSSSSSSVVVVTWLIASSTSHTLRCTRSQRSHTPLWTWSQISL